MKPRYLFPLLGFSAVVALWLYRTEVVTVLLTAGAIRLSWVWARNQARGERR